MNAAGEQTRHPRVGDRVTLVETGTPMIVNAVDFDPDTGTLFVRAHSRTDRAYRPAEDYIRGWPGGHAWDD